MSETTHIPIRIVNPAIMIFSLNSDFIFAFEHKDSVSQRHWQIEQANCYTKGTPTISFRLMSLIIEQMIVTASHAWPVLAFLDRASSQSDSRFEMWQGWTHGHHPWSRTVPESRSIVVLTAFTLWNRYGRSQFLVCTALEVDIENCENKKTTIWRNHELYKWLQPQRERHDPCA